MLRRPFAWLLGAFALLRFLRRRKQPAEPVVDPRAEELKRRLAESRAIVDEREQFEAAETPVDQAEPIGDPDARRRAVHESARETVARMRDKRS